MVLQSRTIIIKKVSWKGQSKYKFFEPSIVISSKLQLSYNRGIGNDHEHFHDFIFTINLILIAHIILIDVVPDILVSTFRQSGDIVFVKCRALYELGTHEYLAL